MSYRVLLVDDSSIVRKMLQKTLKLSGLELSAVFEAGNGKEGLDLLHKEWVDIIFLDINMPVMNGMEFMRILRENELSKGTPVIVVSTEGSKERKEELEKLQINAFIQKPVAPEVLGQTVQGILQGGAHE